MPMETIIIAGSVVVALILLAWIWRWYRKRRVLRSIDRMPIQMVEKPTEKDREAYELLRSYRREVWSSFGEELSFNPRAFSEISFEVVRKIASVYYPDEDEPQYKATVDGLLDLNERVIRRLKDLFDKPIIKKFRGVDVATILSVKKGYEAVRKHPITEFVMSKPALRKLWQAGWSAANLLNPWYWGRKMVIEVGLETGKRYFITGLVTIVGEEAVMLYSGRRIRNEKAAAEMLTAYEMVRSLHDQDSVSAEEYQVLLRWLVKMKHLDSYAKIELIRMLQDKRQMPEQDLTDIVAMGGGKLFLKAFEELAEADGVDKEGKRRALEMARSLFNL